MKEKIIRLISLLMAALSILMLSACGKTKAEIDGPALLQSLLKNVTFSTELSEVGDNAVLYFPGLPEGTEIQLYSGSGYFADEAVLLTLPKASDRADAMKVVKNHIAELCNQFMNYVPEEVGKIDNAITYQNGRYILLCITDDHAKANDILRKAGNASTPMPDQDTTTTTPKESVPETTTPQKNNYPVLQSQSGTYHDYGTGVIRVDDGAFELYGYNYSAAEAYTDIVNHVASALDGKTKVYDLAIPTAVGIVLPDDIAKILPDYTDQNEAIESIFSNLSDNVAPINCYDNLMQHRDEYLYFHTDYHWNGKGAYYAYEAFCQAKGITPIPLSEHKEHQFDGFLGVLYNQNSGNDEILANNPDTVHAYSPKSENASMAYTDPEGNTYDWNIIMDVSDWDADTKYSAFAGADNPIAVFTNPDVTDGSVCVVVKESYGNALLPYLVDHYSTIYEIDYRYWDGNLIDFTLEKGANDLLFANNLSMIGSNFLIGKLAEIVK